MKKKRTSSNDRKTVKMLMKYVGRYKILLFFSILLAGVSVVLTLYIPILAGNAIDCIHGIGNVDFDSIKNILIKVGIITAVTAVIQWIMNMINNRITYRVIRDARNDAFKKLEILPLKYLDSHPHGDTVSRIISDADQFGDGLLMGFSQLFTGVMTIGATLVFMLTINPPITAVVVVLTPLSLFMARFIAKKTHAMFTLRSQTNAEQTSHIEETLGNEKTVQAFSKENDANEKFNEINERLKKCSLKATFFSSLTNPCTRFINSIVYAAVALTGAIGVINGGHFAMTVGGLVSFLSYANQYTKPFNEISGVITELQNSLACAERLFEFINETPEIPDSKDAKTLVSPTGKVDFDSVYFSYTPGKKLIEDFNLSVHPGQRIAIVGPTGCGKTTLINLLMRFYDADSGKISVDGEPIRYLTRKSLRSNYGMVLQDTWLRYGTVRDNIRISKPDATDEEVIAAAKSAHAHSFIKRLPDGYDTVLGESDGGLSQGQKQLLCITRIMLSLPPMLILDEATSSIDTRTELKIQNAFAKMTEGRTSFIVAHRLSTIQSADVILVMKDGKIIEQGNHDSLMAQNGFYTNLYNSQFETT